MNWIEDRIGSAEKGENPTVIRRMRSGFAVIGDVQFLPGYCVLLRSPETGTLSDLPQRERLEFLEDVAILGEAIESARPAEGLRRINYEVLGNLDTYLHAHIWPRYEWEDSVRVTKSVWLYPESNWSDDASQLSPAHEKMRSDIGNALDLLLKRYDATVEHTER